VSGAYGAVQPVKARVSPAAMRRVLDAERQERS